MILLDASSVVGFLAGEPAAPEVRALLREPRVGIPAPNLAEALYIVASRTGVQRARAALRTLTDSVLVVLALDEDRALRAGELRHAHYSRSSRSLSLGDCLLLASAGPEDAVASSDAAVVETARLEGIRAIPLPDSRGVRP